MAGEVGLPPFGHLAYLKAGDTQQYMFRLRGKLSAAQLRQAATLGRMDVLWTSAMGEAGRLTSNSVQRKQPPAKGVEVHSVISPAEVPLWTQFDIKLSLTNLASSEMQLGLEAGIQPSGQAGVVFGGLSMRSLGALQPQATMPVTLSLVALIPGLQRVGGMHLEDALTEQEHDLGTLAEVFVRSAPSACPLPPQRPSAAELPPPHRPSQVE